MRRLKPILILLVVVSTLMAQTPQWHQGTSMPAPRSGHAGAMMNGKLYITGGRQNQGGMHDALGQFWAYDPSQDSWETDLPALPGPREGHSMLALGDTLWIFGGRNHNQILTEVLYWVEGAADWQTGGSMPTARFGMGAVVARGVVYLMGGITRIGMWNPPVDRVDAFDPVSDIWTEFPPLSQGREEPAVLRSGDSLWVVGGSFLDPLPTVEILNLNDGSWTSGPGLPQARGQSAAALWENKPMLTGGITNAGLAQQNLILSSSGWEEFIPNLLPRHGMVTLYDSTQVYVFGGRNGNQILASLEILARPVAVLDPPGKETAGEIIQLRTYPNPANGTVHVLPDGIPPEITDVRLSVYSLTGQLISRKPIYDMNAPISLNSNLFPGSGLFIVEVRGESQVAGHIQISNRIQILK